jgi:hypothetical protein
MKSFIASASVVAVLLVSSTLALPAATKRQSDAVSSVISNIDAWQTDIANVNNFLDQAAAGLLSPGSVDFATAASNVIGDQNGGPPGTASDEPTRLMALTALLASADGNALAASQDLAAQFGGVLTNLQSIVDSGNDIGTVQTAVNNINNLRCFTVLPDISELWFGVVTDNPGAPLPPPVTTGPAVCPVITTATLPF